MSHPTLYYITNYRILLIVFTNGDILNVVTTVDVKNSHGHDDILVRMTEICDSALLRPLSIIYKNSTLVPLVPNITGTFALIWKKPNVLFIYKKNDTQLSRQIVIAVCFSLPNVC